MNATQWETLTDFTKWLGREGEDETDLSSSHMVPWQGGQSCHGFYVNLWERGWVGSEKLWGSVAVQARFCVSH